MDADRRRYLGLLAGAVTGVAGCVGTDGGMPTDGVDDATPVSESRTRCRRPHL